METPRSSHNPAFISPEVHSSYSCDESCCVSVEETEAIDFLETQSPSGTTPIHRPSLKERASQAERDSAVALEIAYDGTQFSGFAKQPQGFTVQGEIEQALSLLMRRPVEVVCAGRTDRGVHCRSQIVSFEADRAEMMLRTPHGWCRSLNALVDTAITIKAIALMPAGFSARFDALNREYRYFISTTPYRSVLNEGRCWDLGKPLDLEAMTAAAHYLVGEHDFASFCMAASAKGKSTIRSIESIALEDAELCGEPMLQITIIGNAFLHSMVRAIVGTLVAVGRGRREPAWVASVLAARDRQAAGENAPAAGLVLWSVGYPLNLTILSEATWPAQWDQASVCL